MYVVAVGANDVGTPLVGTATRSGNEVVVIERDAQKADSIASGHDCMVLNADATTKETLADADAERADTIVSTTDQDATNVVVRPFAKEFDVPEIASVVHDAGHVDLFRQIGVNTIEDPQRFVAEYLYRAVARPAIVDHVQIGGDTEIFEITVTEDAPFVEKTLTEAGKTNLLPDDVPILAIEHENRDELSTPRGGTRIEANNLLIVYSATGAEPELTGVFGHDENRTA